MAGLVCFIIFILFCLNAVSSAENASCLVKGCHNGGRCLKVNEVAVEGGSGRREVHGSWMKCACPLPTGGPTCSQKLHTKFPRFHGDGYLKMFGLPSTAFQKINITIEIKADAHYGLLLFATSGSFSEKYFKDFIAVSLVSGHVEFRFDCGSGIVTIRSLNKVLTNSWNTIEIGRINKIGWLKLNDGIKLMAKSKGPFSKISLKKEFYIGGHPNVSHFGEVALTTHGMVGCMRKIFVDGVKLDMRKTDNIKGDALDGWNVDNCIDTVGLESKCQATRCLNGGTCSYDELTDRIVCWCTVGWRGPHCEIASLGPILKFNRNSYLLLNQQAILELRKSNLIEITFRNEQNYGLLFFIGMLQNVIGDYIILSLNDGYLCLVYNLGSGIFSMKSKFRMQRNIWHSVYFNRSQKSVEMVVDSVDSTSVTSPGRFFELTLGKNHVVYVGGHPDIDSMPREIGTEEGFQGCIRNLKIGKVDVNLSGDHVGGRNVARCWDVCAGGACMPGRCLENADGWFSCLTHTTTLSHD